MNTKDIKKLEMHPVYPIVKDTIRRKIKAENKEQNKLRARKNIHSYGHR